MTLEISGAQGFISTDGIWRGAWKMAPLAGFTVPFGIAFSVAALEAGMTSADVILMSATVFAAASQFAALEIWGPSIPLLPLILIALAVNARFILMGAALYPWMRALPWSKRLTTAIVLTDPNFAAGMADYHAGRRDAGVIIGGGVTMWLAWITGTIAGVLFGNHIGDPHHYALDVIMIAYFAALLAGAWRGKATFAPWIVAAVVSLVAYWWGPENWHVVIGALAGGVVGGMQNVD